MQVLSSAETDGILGSFPLIVMDDGPSPTLKRQILEQFPTVDFRSHDKNMGMAKSVLDLLQACPTEYCMMSADDDFLNMGGLEKASSYVLESSPDLISTQFLSGDQMTRGREGEGPIGYSEIGQACYHAPGLIYKVATARKYIAFLEKLLERGNYIATTTPQVALAFLILLEGGSLRWHPSVPVVEGFAAPSQLRDAEGDLYNKLAGRVREYEGWIEFFQAYDRCPPLPPFSETGRSLAKQLGTLKQQELYSHIASYLDREGPEAGRSFRGASSFYNLRRPWKALSELVTWIISRKRAHNSAAHLQSVLRHPPAE